MASLSNLYLHCWVKAEWSFVRPYRKTELSHALASLRTLHFPEPPSLKKVLRSARIAQRGQLKPWKMVPLTAQVSSRTPSPSTAQWCGPRPTPVQGFESASTSMQGIGGCSLPLQ
eukprot:1159063-Pelagomonas_calceolata.AAC.4